MSSDRIPVLLVTGTAGAGKSTFIRRRLSSRPEGQRWAVLLNDFGEVTLTDAGVLEHGVVVREVAGCICCSAQVSLRTALVTLIRESRPRRLLIEASAAAHPREIVKVLDERGIAAAVELEPIVCIVDPAHALDPRYASLELYREQVKAADRVILGKTDVRSAEEINAARAALLAMGARHVE